MDGIRTTIGSGSTTANKLSYTYAASTTYSHDLATGSATIIISGQSTTASNTTTYTNCSGSSFSVQNPYTVVYMYKRTA